MPVTREESNGLVQLRIEGPLTAAEVGAVHRALLDALAGGGPVEIHAGEITDCDTLGVQLLCAALKGRENVPVVRELSSPVREAADRAGLSSAMLFHPREEE